MKTKDQVHTRLQIQLLLSQLAALRRELRETLHAYEARLEIALAEIVKDLVQLEKSKALPKGRLGDIERMIASVRKRKVKPEKGRRKDLRKFEDLIKDLHVTMRRET